MLTPERLAKITRVAAARQSGLTIVLEDIQDPHNAEAIFRSCDAFGIQQVHLVFNCIPPFDPRKIGKASSSSANKWLDFTTHGSIGDCLKELQEQDFELIGTALAGQAESIFSTDLTGKRLAILVGNEGDGLSPAALAGCDRLLMIPMAGMVQSLNVSVATALCLFEITRQRTASGKSFVLEQAQIQTLTDDFQQRNYKRPRQRVVDGNNTA